MNSALEHRVAQGSLVSILAWQDILGFYVMWGQQYSRRPRTQDAARGAPKGVQEPKEAQAAVINGV
jgi:hypothetical protein